MYLFHVWCASVAGDTKDYVTIGSTAEEVLNKIPCWLRHDYEIKYATEIDVLYTGNGLGYTRNTVIFEDKFFKYNTSCNRFEYDCDVDFARQGATKLYIEGYDDEHNERFDALGDKWRSAHYVYADGQLEHLAHYDIVGYSDDDKFDFIHDRIQEVVAVLPTGKELEAILFFWHSKPYDEECAKYMKMYPIYECHGLLVAKNDEQAIKSAKKMFEEKWG